MRRIIVFSGPIAVGKSTVIEHLCHLVGGVRISTRELIQKLKPNVPSSRSELQAAGEALDSETHGKWVANSIASIVHQGENGLPLVVDSARIPSQVKELKREFGEVVYHIHLTAPRHVLERNFDQRKQKQGNASLADCINYEDLLKSNTESQISSMSAVADKVINVERLEPASVVTLALAGLNLQAIAEQTRLVDVVVGGQYGSEGKGNVCDYLGCDYSVLMRVGGPNAGHKVANPPYDYIHMPSATGGNPNTKILIGAGATLDLVQVLREILDLKLAPERLAIDPQAIVIEQSDIYHEIQNGDKIGSTKKGVGIATARKIVGRFMDSPFDAPVRLAKDIKQLADYVRPVTDELEIAYRDGKRVLLEGTQGTALSLHHGSYPNVTSRETTTSGCLSDAGIPPHRVDRVYMVARTYPIRVGGTSGNMGLEISCETIAERSGLPEDYIKKIEIGTVSKKPRRIAEFCWESVRRAAIVNGATDIALTFADYLDAANQKATTYNELTPDTRAMICEIENVTGVRVSLVSVGFGRQAMIDRRK